MLNVPKMTTSRFVLSFCLAACGGQVVKASVDANAATDAIADATQEDTSEATWRAV